MLAFGQNYIALKPQICLLAYPVVMQILLSKIHDYFAVKKIVVHLRGGVGNQIFQASAGYYLANNLGARLYLDLSSVAFHESGNPVDISRMVMFEVYSVRRSPLKNIPNRLLLKLSRVLPDIDRKKLNFNPLGPHDRIFKFWRAIHINGYFADFRYAKKSQLFDAKVNLDNPSPWFKEMYNYFSKESVVAIHVRRGDFLLNPAHYGVLSIEYYRKALRELPGSLRNAPIWIFSDDISLAKEIFEKVENHQFNYLKPGDDSNALESLLLMSLAKGIIVANSTYSLWAGFMSSNPEIICYPSTDINGQELAAGIPTTWKQIESSWE